MWLRDAMQWLRSIAHRGRRLRYLAQNLRTYDADLNRRAAVERHLWGIVAGKRQPPGPDECRALALKLGVPDEYRQGEN